MGRLLERAERHARGVGFERSLGNSCDTKEHNAYLAGIIKTNTLPRASPVLVNMRLFARALPAKAPGDKKAAVEDEVKHFLETSKDLAKSALRENKAASVSQLSTLQERLKTLSAFFHYQPTNGPAPQPKAARRI